MGREEFLGAVVEKLREVDAGPGRLSVDVQKDGRIVVEIEDRPKWTPNMIHPHVLCQDRIWIDTHGREHKIYEMPRAYVANVLGFLFRNVTRFRSALAEANTFEIERILGHNPSTYWKTAETQEEREQDNSWLTRSPLVNALMEELEF